MTKNKPARYYLLYAIKPNDEYLALEIQKILKLLGASESKVSTKHITNIDENWLGTKGEIIRYDITSKWRSKNEMFKVKNIIDNWIRR